MHNLKCGVLALNAQAISKLVLIIWWFLFDHTFLFMYLPSLIGIDNMLGEVTEQCKT